MNHRIKAIQENIAPLRNQIIEHKAYAQIKSMEDLRIFMEQHIYAVWDFMSLLKSLQKNLTCVETPWVPKGDAATRYLINEIVVGEESDVDEDGVRTSHFELYLKAMKQSGADTAVIECFIDTLLQKGDLEGAFKTAEVPEAAREFMRFTFKSIYSNKPHVLAAIFTFGREDLIPDMFMSIIEDVHNDVPKQISTFKYYLERHIEVDGDHHSHLAMQMTALLCGEDEQLWEEAEAAVIQALQMRVLLWDGVHDAIIKSKTLENELR
jgi:hypothetical protein